MAVATVGCRETIEIEVEDRGWSADYIEDCVLWGHDTVDGTPEPTLNQEIKRARGDVPRRTRPNNRATREAAVLGLFGGLTRSSW